MLMKKRIFTLSLFGLILLLGGSALQAQTKIFVRNNGSNNNSGLSWEQGKQTLAGALDIAQSGDTIYMRVGTYSPNNDTIPAGVTVIGGFASTLTGTDVSQRIYPGVHYQWEDASHSTILDPVHVNRAAYVEGRLENCIIRNGYVVGNGGGAFIHGGTVSHCVIIRNLAANDEEHPDLGYGGGVYIDNGGKLINCVVSYNLAEEGLAVAGADGELINNTITQNDAVANCGLITDVEGHVYTTAKIGDQCWMAENLRTRHYADGTEIPANYYGYPNNNISFIPTYGILYAAYSFLNHTAPSQGPCPDGWRIPTTDDFNTLINYVNATPQYRYNGQNNQYAKALASKGSWVYNGNRYAPGYHPASNNATGFNATCGYDGYGERYWTSTNYGNNTYHLYLNYYSDRMSSSDAYRSNTYNIRCIKE